MRSRTGCLTCRARKLKCDEQKPQCSQCLKASRECKPSEGIVFRHQQNASMNREGGEDREVLKGFYSYKDTFDKDSVWLDIPKQVTFIDVTNPYAEEDDYESTLPRPETPPTLHLPPPWGHESSIQPSYPAEVGTHGLEALSAAATADTYALQHRPTTAAAPVAIYDPFSSASYSQANTRHLPESVTHHDEPRPAITNHSLSPSMSVESNNNINFLLNPPMGMSPSIDPTLYPPTDRGGWSRQVGYSRSKWEMEVETGHEIAFLLRHFSESPGQWMDLFDRCSYFASYVPVKAVTNPLLKYAACAYAAKQLGRVRGKKGSIGGVCNRPAKMELCPGGEHIDWYFRAAKYYEKAIRLLMEALQHRGQALPIDTVEGLEQWQAAELCNEVENGHLKRRRRSSNSGFSGAKSDEVLAATAILSVYEFLDATGPAWDRHLSGVKSLLDIAEVGIMPLEKGLSSNGNRNPVPCLPKPGYSKARKATFWNFARQDYLSAYINKCRCRLDMDDLYLWREAGLILDEMGFVQPSINLTSQSESNEPMMEDMISNALVWLSSKIVNLLASSGAGTHPPDQATASQWRQVRTEVDAWYNRLPDTFKPCARVDYSFQSKTNQEPFQEIWYSTATCAAAMQHYHMARILLLTNAPYQPDAFHQSIHAEILHHCHEICGISLSRPDASVRINSVQPLFLSGQYLSNSRERTVVLHLLRGIENDLGWATGYRVEQLLKQWGWDHNALF